MHAFCFQYKLYFFFIPILAFYFLILFSLFLVGCLCVFIPNPCPVLEFELRKAKETIQALRANLTKAAGGVHKTFLRLFLLWQCRSSWDIFKCKIVKYYLYFFHQNTKFLYRNEKITNQVLKFRWVNDRPKSIFHIKW